MQCVVIRNSIYRILSNQNYLHIPQISIAITKTSTLKNLHKTENKFSTYLRFTSYRMTEMKRLPLVLVTHPEISKLGLDLLKENFEIRMCEKLPPERTEILEKCKGVDAILWATHDKLNAEILEVAGNQLKVISTISAGIDYVDVAHLQSKGIKLGHTPKVLSGAVADLAIGLMLAAARRFHEGRQKILQSKWETWHHNWMLGCDISGSTVGFVGYGNIGQLITKRLTGFDIGSFLYTSRNRNPHADKLNAKYVQFNDILKESDIIFIVCPLTNETEKLFDENAFNKMKSNCILINTARGKIVDQKAQYNALKSNKIFAAGIDVMDPEPLPANDPLLELPNCVITPHLGSATKRTRDDMCKLGVQNIINALAGKEMIAPAYVIN